jgi:drug/metabolite transporter (DMT)-like permease
LDNLKKKEYFADLSLIFISLIWGSTFIVIKKSIDAFDPISFLSIRFLIASAIMLPIAYTRVIKADKKALKDGLILGFVLFIVFFFQTLALKFSPATEVGFLTGLYVLFVPVFSAIFLKKSPHLFSWIGVVLSALGMVMITMAGSISISVGQIFAILNAFFLGVQIILTDKYSRKHDIILLTALQIFAVAGFSTIYSIGFENPDYSLVFDPYIGSSLLFNSIVATVFCFFVQTSMQKHTTPTKAAIMFTMEPISSAFFSFIIGGELLMMKQYAGAAFIIFAIIIAEVGTELRLSKKLT